MGHSHSHGGLAGMKADGITNRGTVGELVDNAAGNFLWGYGICKMAYGVQGEENELANIICGLVAIILTPGSVYAHRMSSKLGQYLNNLLHAPAPSAEHVEDLENQIANLQQPLNPNEAEEKTLHEESKPHCSHTTITQQLGTANTPLSKLQYAALITDFISHTGERSGPIADVFTKIFAPTGWKMVLSPTISTLFSAYTVVDKVRNCKSAIALHNKPKDTQEDKHSHESSSPKPS